MKGASARLDVSLSGVHVLAVDDDAAVLDAVTATLERYGATVTAVDTAPAALEALQRERPDVLVSDLTMPDRGGYWLIGQVRALPPERGGQTPAAALTILIGAEHRASVLRAGFQYHIDKPVEPIVLGGIIALLALKAE
jgi:CheY-like chemotaxis protein